MITKKCEFCGKEFEVKYALKRFCNSSCQGKHYNRRLEIKKRRSLWEKEYRKRHPEWKEKHRIRAATTYREQRSRYIKEYFKRPKVREKMREYEKMRLRTDKEYAIADRLRRSLNHAMKKYSKTGKIMNSKKYGINWKEVIESLKPFPEDLKKYEIDHIIPLHIFDLTDTGQIKIAFSPSNLQWLTVEDNRRKSGKLLNINKQGIN